MSSEIDEVELENRLYERLLAHVDDKITEVVKAHIKPTLQLFIDREDSVLDETVFDGIVDSPCLSRSSVRLSTQNKDACDERLKSLEEVVENQIKSQLARFEGFFESYRKDRNEIMMSFALRSWAILTQKKLS